MARIPDSEIERLKKEVSLERLVEAHGVKLKRHGNDLFGLCPFHKDTDPSLVVTPDKNVWHCLGACQTGGSVVDWVMKAQGVSFRHAIEILRADEMPTTLARPVKIATVPRLPAPVTLDADDQALLKQVVGYYHQTLKKSPEALAYLKSRGIASPELIERYQIGFANRTLGLRLPEKNRKSGLEIRARLQNAGILRKETGHEHFNGSIVIPIVDEQGNVLEMYGRKITPRLRAGTPDHLYLPGRHHGVFNVEALARYREIILCEALIDALTFLNAGYPNVTTSYGVNGVTPDHWAAFRKFKTQRVLIAYDRDEAGETAARALAAELMAAGVECFRIQFPHGMDANEYALKVQPAPKSLGLVIRKAAWMGTGAAPSRGEDVPIVDVLSPVSLPPDPVEPASLRSVVPAPPHVEVLPPEPVPVCPTPAAATLPAQPPAMPTSTSPPAASSPPVTPVPSPPRSGPALERHGQEVRIVLGDRQYRIRGLAKNTTPGQLKVNVVVTRGDLFHEDTLDLCLARPRLAYSRDAALELGLDEDVTKKDLGRILQALEDLQEKQMNAAASVTPEVELTPAEREEALELLRDPRLLDRVLEAFHQCGVVGEEINLLVGYLASVTRLLDTPLAVVIQSSSAAGKSSLMEAILAFCPTDHRVKYSAMTGQSLFYMGSTDLQHKVLAIVEEEGAERASYALKLLQSEGELTIASTGKDPATGRHVTHEYRVEGPVMIFLTTTAVEIDEELLNRCVVLSVNEDREQTRIIHQQQRERQTLEGQLMRRDASWVQKLQQNAQRLLRPLLVANPYAPRLTFRDDQTRTRRDHGKYLTLIRVVTLLHQYQRPVRAVDHRGQKIEYIEVTRDDIRVANRLANEVLGRTLDELPPQTRRLLVRLDVWVREECERLQMARMDFRFQRKDVREFAGKSETRARAHLDKLVAFEYVIVHRGARGQSFVYELIYDGQGQDGQPFVMGLIDPDALEDEREYDAKFAGSKPGFAGQKESFAGGSPPHRLPIAASSPGGGNGSKTVPGHGFGDRGAKNAKNTVLDSRGPVVLEPAPATSSPDPRDVS